MKRWLKRLFRFTPRISFPEMPSHETWYATIWSDVAAGRYPEWADLEWYACDSHGRIGFFTTAGSGIVPRAVFRSKTDYLTVQDALWHLPYRCGYTLHEAGEQRGRVDDWVEMAQRGLFGYDYDWEDVRKPDRPNPGYCLVASPHSPLGLSDLSAHVAEWLREIVWRAAIFSEGRPLFPQEEFLHVLPEPSNPV